MKRYRCIHCRQPVQTVTIYGEGGTRWIHSDGFEECRPTYAAPNFDEPVLEGAP